MHAQRYALLVILALAIIVGAALPGQHADIAPILRKWAPALLYFGADAVMHVCAFSAAVVLSSWALRSVAGGMVVALLLSFGVEGMQYFLPHRTAGWTDVGWNFVAIGAGGLLAAFLASGAQGLRVAYRWAVS